MSARRATAGKVAGPRVTDGHGGVAVQQHDRHRLADDVAPADHDGVTTRDGDIGSFEQLDHAGRGARRERLSLLHQTPDIHRAEPVDVLGGVDRVEHDALRVIPHGRRQRRLNENPIGPVAAIELVDDREQVVEATASRDTGAGRRRSRRPRRPSACCARTRARPGRRRRGRGRGPVGGPPHPGRRRRAAGAPRGSPTRFAHRRADAPSRQLGSRRGCSSTFSLSSGPSTTS